MVCDPVLAVSKGSRRLRASFLERSRSGLDFLCGRVQTFAQTQNDRDEGDRTGERERGGRREREVVEVRERDREKKKREGRSSERRRERERELRPADRPERLAFKK